MDCCSERLSGAKVYVENGRNKVLIGTLPNTKGKSVVCLFSTPAVHFCALKILMSSLVN